MVHPSYHEPSILIAWPWDPYCPAPVVSDVVIPRRISEYSMKTLAIFLLGSREYWWVGIHPVLFNQISMRLGNVQSKKHFTVTWPDSSASASSNQTVVKCSIGEPSEKTWIARHEAKLWETTNSEGTFTKEILPAPKVPRRFLCARFIQQQLK